MTMESGMTMDGRTLEALKADADAKKTAAVAAERLYADAMCAANPIQPGDVIEVDVVRRVPNTFRRKEVTKRYRVKHLRFGYRVELHCAEILAGGRESGVVREIWRDYRKAATQPAPGEE
jgi:protein involved in polysaccharide export with SLBB domain